MYTIGQFSKIGRVSTKTLRYYDDINLLKPVHVDQNSQYRYYSDEQVLKIIMISELKDYGLKLEEIKVILDNQDTNLLKEFLERKINELNKQVQKNLELKKFIKQKIMKIDLGGNLMETNKDMTVELKNREDLIVAYRRVTSSMSNISNIIGKVYEDIYQMNLQSSGPVMTVYYDKEFDVENTDYEICIPVNKKVNKKNDKLKIFAGGLHAYTTFVGPYTRLGEAYAKVMKWIEENGYKNTGEPFDIYIMGPRTAKNPDQFVTEVYFPVSK